MKDYKRLTMHLGGGVTLNCKECELNENIRFCTDEECITVLKNRLCDLEDKIENGTLVFKKEIPNKYYALVLHRDCYGKNSWHIHHVPIEYEKENNRVAIQVNGILYVTTKNMLFKTKAEAEVKVRELKGERQ